MSGELAVTAAKRLVKGDRLRIVILMKVRKIMQMLTDDGWYVARTRGSHRQRKHPDKPGLVTVSGKPSDELASGTLNSILKQAGLK